MKELENQKHFLKEQIASEELREQCDIKLETIVKYFNSFVGNIDDEDVRSLVLDIFVDKIYIYKEKMVITCHFTEDKQELSYAETLEMIENHEYLMDTVNNPEAHFVSSPVAEKMRESLVGHGGENPDFFQ